MGDISDYILSGCPKGGHKLGLKCRHNSDCPLYADYKTECYKGECCTKKAGGIDLTPYDKELCKNGGYFVSSPCQTLEDCRVFILACVKFLGEKSAQKF